MGYTLLPADREDYKVQSSSSGTGEQIILCVGEINRHLVHEKKKKRCSVFGRGGGMREDLLILSTQEGN